MKFKMVKVFNLPIFNVTVTIGFDKDEFVKATHHTMVPYDGHGGCTYKWQSDGIEGVALYFDPNQYGGSLLTHECCHAAWYVLDIIGATASVEDNELHAYLAGYIAREANNFFKDEWVTNGTATKQST